MLYTLFAIVGTADQKQPQNLRREKTGKHHLNILS